MSSAEDVERWVETVERELGPVDLLAANAGISTAHEDVWEVEPEEWWHVLEVNVLGVFLCCRAVVPSMLGAQAGANRVTAVAPRTFRGRSRHAYTSSKAAVHRFAETLANQVRGRIAVFFHQPRTRPHGDDRGAFGDDAPWTPPELAPKLVRVLASGRADALAGRYIHAEHDDIEDLIARADTIVAERSQRDPASALT